MAQNAWQGLARLVANERGLFVGALIVGGVALELGVPMDFVLFGLTLAGVALFHRHVLWVALIGLAVIVLYKIGFTGFKTGAGIPGFGRHLLHEWVILTNLLGLLLGFALLSNHFEEVEDPGGTAALPAGRLEGRVRAAGDDLRAVLVPRQHRRRDHRRHHCRARCSARKVHIGYLAAIVAASNAGGSGSVVGDTTTTMMWIDGVSPLVVLEAYIAAAVAMVIFGIPAALQQHRHSPIIKDAKVEGRIDWARVAIVLVILAAAIVTNVLINIHIPDTAGSFPFIGAAVWVAILACVPWRKPDWKLLPEAFKGSIFLLSLILCASMMPVEKLPPASWQIGVRPGLRVRRVRQHPAHGARAQAGRLRLGVPRLRRRLWRLDDLVRLQRRRGPLQPVSRGEVGRLLATPRLARGSGLRHRFLRPAGDPGLARRRGAQSPPEPEACRRAECSPFRIVKCPCGGERPGVRMARQFTNGAQAPRWNHTERGDPK